MLKYSDYSNEEQAKKAAEKLDSTVCEVVEGNTVKAYRVYYYEG